MKTIHIDGPIETIVVTALVEYRDDLAKIKKKLAKKHMDVAEAETNDRAAKDLLDQLGWTSKGGSSSAEVTDGKQLPLPLGAVPHRARVKCLGCARNFAVPAGETTRACPDCGTIHRVKSDEDGTLYMRRQVVEPPDDIRTLFAKEADPTLGPLSQEEWTQLAAWKAENPEHTTHGEDIPRGDRVADPEVPGSGNPLRINCSVLAGRDCTGFDTTDTPGVSVCHSCGQKYVVDLVDGGVLPRVWSLDDEAEEQDEEQDEEEQSDDED